MYELQQKGTTEIRRCYRSSITSTEIYTKVLYTDGSGKNWWCFEDLLQIPYIRKKAAESCSQLYGLGLTHNDLNDFIKRQKTTLKDTTDSERFERAYSQLLQMEELITETANPVKQSLSLCAVYILGEDERVDSFSIEEAISKMNLWEVDYEAQAFFLNWLAAGMSDYLKHYNSIMEIASILQEKPSI